MASLIQVLGPGCQKCQVLYERVNQAVKETGTDCHVEKVTDIQVIVNMGVLSTPALVIDGTVKLSGRVPTVEQIKEMLA
jgi:small redox-active disulfide protein 2